MAASGRRALAPGERSRGLLIGLAVWGCRSRNRGSVPRGQAFASMAREGNCGTKETPGTAKRSPRKRE
jgi:hypothetical protein